MPQQIICFTTLLSFARVWMQRPRERRKVRVLGRLWQDDQARQPANPLLLARCPAVQVCVPFVFVFLNPSGRTMCWGGVWSERERLREDVVREQCSTVCVSCNCTRVYAAFHALCAHLLLPHSLFGAQPGGVPRRTVLDDDGPAARRVCRAVLTRNNNVRRTEPAMPP